MRETFIVVGLAWFCGWCYCALLWAQKQVSREGIVVIPDPGEGYRLVDVEREGVDLSAEVWLYSTGEWGLRGIPGDPYIRGNHYRVRLVEMKYPHWPDVKVSEESLFEDCVCVSRGRSAAVVVWGAGVLVFLVGFVIGLCF